MVVQSFLNERKYEMNGKTWYEACCKHCDYVQHDFVRQTYRCTLLSCNLGKGEEIPDDCPLARRYSVKGGE